MAIRTRLDEAGALFIINRVRLSGSGAIGAGKDRISVRNAKAGERGGSAFRR
jgi:hypothetical protein